MYQSNMNYKNVSILLKEYNYVIMEEDWINSTKDHPDFPQINAFVDILSEYAIPSYIAKVPLSLYKELPNTFIGLVTQDGQPETVIVTKLLNSKTKLTFYNNTIIINQADFVNIWDGYILVIEENEKPANVSYTKHYSRNIVNILPVFLLSIFCISSYFYCYIDWSSLLLIAINSIGLFLSYLALKESFGFGNKSLFIVCSSIKNGNCNQVIKSSNATLLFGVTYSDLSFVFFTYSFLISFFALTFPYFLLFNILLIPFLFIIVLYSIYQQKFIIKQWCILCLGISFVSITQALILVLNFDFYFNFQYVVLSLIILSSILILWMAIKPIISHYSELIFEKYQRDKIYKNEEVFGLYFMRSSRISNEDFQKLSAINLNNVNTPLSLTIILSLNCEYCKFEYAKFRKLMFYHDKTIGFNILFDFNLDQIETSLISVLENLYLLNKTNMVVQALDDFFIGNKSTNDWLKKWGQQKNFHSSLIYNNIKILNMNKITDTPCMLINNCLYPKEYKIEDVRYFLDYLRANIAE